MSNKIAPFDSWLQKNSSEIFSKFLYFQISLCFQIGLWQSPIYIPDRNWTVLFLKNILINIIFNFSKHKERIKFNFVLVHTVFEIFGIDTFFSSLFY